MNIQSGCSQTGPALIVWRLFEYCKGFAINMSWIASIMSQRINGFYSYCELRKLPYFILHAVFIFDLMKLTLNNSDRISLSTIEFSSQ